jgi:hypothetical protein
VGSRDAVEAETRAWLENALDEGMLERDREAPMYDADGRPLRMTKLHFDGLVRKLRMLRWLDRMRFDSFIDVASGWENFPAIVRRRYGVPSYGSDLNHALNHPVDMALGGKVDHAVTLNLASLPFADGAFDAVVCSEVLEHLVCPVEAVSELMRVARRYLIVTSLETLAADRFRRWISEMRLDVRVPHVERNFLVAAEVEALFGAGSRHENLLHLPSMPGGGAGGDEAVTGLADLEALVAALVRAVSTTAHGPGGLGLLVVKLQPGVPLAERRPGADEELARLVIAEAARFERHAHDVLVTCARHKLGWEEPPADPALDRPVADELRARLRCPDCRAAGFAARGGPGLVCSGCGASFRSEYGVPILYPTLGDAAGPSEAECLARLCAGDAAAARIVQRVRRRLRRNEHGPRALQRIVQALERRFGPLG